MSSSPEPMHVKDSNEIFMKMFPPICEIDINPSQHPANKSTKETVLRDWQSWNHHHHNHHHHNHPHPHHPHHDHTGRGVGERDLNQIYQLHLQDSESSPRDFIPTSEIHFLFKTKIHFAIKPKYTSYSKPKFVLCPKPKYIFVGSKSQRRSFYIWNCHALGRSEISSVPFVQHFQIHY